MGSFIYLKLWLKSSLIANDFGFSFENLVTLFSTLGVGDKCWSFMESLRMKERVKGVL